MELFTMRMYNNNKPETDKSEARILDGFIGIILTCVLLLLT